MKHDQLNMAVLEVLEDVKEQLQRATSPWLTRSEAANHLRVSIWSIIRYEQAGLIKRYDNGDRGAIYHRRELDAAVRAGKLRNSAGALRSGRHPPYRSGPTTAGRDSPPVSPRESTAGITETLHYSLGSAKLDPAESVNKDENGAT